MLKSIVSAQNAIAFAEKEGRIIFNARGLSLEKYEQWREELLAPASTISRIE